MHDCDTNNGSSGSRALATIAKTHACTYLLTCMIVGTGGRVLVREVQLAALVWQGGSVLGGIAHQ